MWFHELHDSYNQLFPLCFKWQEAYTQIYGLLQLDFLYLRFCCSVTRSCPTLWPHWLQLSRLPWSSLSLGVYLNSCLWVDDAIQSSRPLSLLSPPALNLSWHQGLFQWVGSSNQVATKYWNFSFSISPSNACLGLISFRIDWFGLYLLGWPQSLSITSYGKTWMNFWAKSVFETACSMCIYLYILIYSSILQFLGIWIISGFRLLQTLCLWRFLLCFNWE